MTPTFEFKQNAHLNPALTDPATKTLSADRLVGRWRNTDSATRGFAEIEIKRQDRAFIVRASCVGADGPIEWPPTEASALANLEEEAGQRALAFAVSFDFGFMRADAYLRVNKGVLVIVHFSSFKDASGRSNYVNREFFYRIAES